MMHTRNECGGSVIQSESGVERPWRGWKRQPAYIMDELIYQYIPRAYLPSHSTAEYGVRFSG